MHFENLCILFCRICDSILLLSCCTYVFCNDDYCCLQIPHDEKVAIWSTISKETKSLIDLNGIASVSSIHPSGFRAKRGSKGTVSS